MVDSLHHGQNIYFVDSESFRIDGSLCANLPSSQSKFGSKKSKGSDTGHTSEGGRTGPGP